MRKYKFILALSVGICFSSCLGVAQREIRFLVSDIKRAPSSREHARLCPLGSSSELFSPPGTFAGNSLLYSPLAYGLVSIKSRSTTEAKMRLAAIWGAVLAFALILLACIPTFNPLLPRGMSALAKQEVDLEQALPLGTKLRQARDVLNSRGIVFQQDLEKSTLVLNGKNGRVTAASGDQVISSRLQTEAGQFPCRYAIDIVLVFGQDDALKQKSIHWFPLCP